MNNFVVENLEFSYKNSKNLVLKNFNYCCTNGQIIGIYGNNGVGKTTLLNCFGGYLNVKRGFVKLNNKPIDLSKTEIGYITSENDLVGYLTLYENVMFYLKFMGEKFNEKEYLILKKNYNLLNDNILVNKSSKGMIQKIKIINSFLLNPKLILADEPTTGLDEAGAAQFFEDIQLLAENGAIIFLTLHNIDKLKKICNDIIYLY